MPRRLAHELLFWSALPWLLPQALVVRRRAPRFAPAPGDAAGTIPASAVGGSPLHVLGIGDSIIAGVGAGHQERALVARSAAALAARSGRTVHWHAAGWSGATSADLIGRLDALASLPADFIVVSAGVNDLTTLVRTRTWRHRCRQLQDGIAQRWPQATVAIAGLPPLHVFPLLPEPLRALMGYRARHLDRENARLVARRAGFRHVPVAFAPEPGLFSADGFHPSDEGHAALAAAVASGWGDADFAGSGSFR